MVNQTPNYESEGVVWVGHCFEDGHNKVWGIVRVGPDEFSSFWFRVGSEKIGMLKAPLHKMDKKYRSKATRYKSTTLEALEEIDPGITDRVMNNVLYNTIVGINEYRT